MAHKAEILAPCGSFETLEAALRSGCDAVYLGGEKFSARQNAANFTDEQLKEAVRLCHLRGVKVYDRTALEKPSFLAIFTPLSLCMVIWVEA